MFENNICDNVPDDFWKLIEDSDRDTNKFRQLLKKLNREQINWFYWTYEELANGIRADRMRSAGYLAICASISASTSGENTGISAMTIAGLAPGG